MKIIIEIEPKELIELNNSIVSAAVERVRESTKCKKPSVKFEVNREIEEIAKNMSKEINKIMTNY